MRQPRKSALTAGWVPDSKESVEPAALNQLSKNDLVTLLLEQAANHAATMAALHARIAELERWIGLNSGSSGKPPSNDGLKKPVRISSLREKTGQKSGGDSQAIPAGTLRQTATPDVTIDHFPEICAGCGVALNEVMAQGHAARQVFDLPAPQPLLVTEHRAHTCQCAGCGTHIKAPFPA